MQRWFKLYWDSFWPFTHVWVWHYLLFSHEERPKPEWVGQTRFSQRLAVSMNMILFHWLLAGLVGGRGDIRRALLEGRREWKKLILQTAWVMIPPSENTVDILMVWTEGCAKKSTKFFNIIIVKSGPSFKILYDFSISMHFFATWHPPPMYKRFDLK